MSTRKRPTASAIKLDTARKQHALRWAAEQADLDDNRDRPLELMDFPNELLMAIFRPRPCPRDAANPPHAENCKCGNKHRVLCTTLCRRTYYLYRQQIEVLDLCIPKKADPMMYNLLKSRSEHTDEWQNAAFTLTPMPALRTIQYHGSPHSYGCITVLSRAAIPWYYLMAVTTAEQRRLITLKVSTSHLQGIGGVKFQPALYLLILGFKELSFSDCWVAITLLKKLQKMMPTIRHHCDQIGVDFEQLQWPLFNIRWCGFKGLKELHHCHPHVAQMCRDAGVQFRRNDRINMYNPCAMPPGKKQYTKKTQQLFAFPLPDQADIDAPPGKIQPISERVVGEWVRGY